MKKEIDIKSLVELLKENEINNYEINNEDKRLRIKNIKTFDEFISRYHVKAFRADHGYYAPYGFNEEVYAEYQGWKITSSLLYSK